MSDYVSLGDLENDPSYRAADGVTQATARQLWLQQYGGMTPGYAEAAMEDRFAFESAVINRAPRLEQDDPLASEWLDVADRAALGDEQAIARARQIHVENMIGESGGLIGWLGTKLLEAAGVGDFQRADTETDRKDRTKAFEYFQGKTSQNDKVMDWSMTLGNLGISASGVITDLLLLRGAGKALGVAAQGLAGESAVGRAAANITGYMSSATRAQTLQKIESLGSRSKFILGELVPTVAGSALDGAALTASQEFRKQSVQETWGAVSPQLQKQAIQVFGESVIMDIALWTGLTALKPIFLQAKLGLSKIGEFADMTPGQTSKAIDDFSQMKDLLPEEMTQLKANHPQAFEAWMTIQNQEWKKANSIDFGNFENDPAALEMMAARSGYTIGRGSDGVTVNLLNQEAEIMGRYGTHLEAFDALDAHLKQLDELADKVKPSDVLVKPDSTLQIGIKLSGKLNKSGQDPTILYTAQAFTPNAVGKLDFEPFNSVNVKYPEGKQFKQVSESEFLAATIKAEDDVIPIPATMTAPETGIKIEEAVVPNFMTKIEKIQGPEIAQLYGDIFKNTKDVTRDAFNTAWISRTSQELGIKTTLTEKGGLQIIQPDGVVRDFLTTEGAVAWMYQQKGMLSEADFTAVMRRQHSLGVERVEVVNPYTGTKSSKLVVRQIGDFNRKDVSKAQAGGIVVEGEDVASIIDQRPDLKPLLPAAAAPYLQIVDPTGNLVMDGINASGSVKTLRELQRNFFFGGKNSAAGEFEEAVVRTVGENKISYRRSNATYTVTIPEYGLQVQTTSLKRAQELIEKGAKNYSDLETVARMKDVAVDYRKGNIYLRSVDMAAKGEPPVLARNLDEAAKWLKEQPDAQLSSGEMTGYFASLDDITEPHLKELVEAQYPRNVETISHGNQYNAAIKRHHWYGKGARPGSDAVGYLIDGMDSQFRKMSENIGDPRAYQIYDKISSAHVKVKGKANQVDHLMNTIVHGLSKKQRETMTKLFGVPQSEWAETWAKLMPQDNGIPEIVTQKMNQARQLLDNHKTVFGIDPYIVLDNYFPRLKDALAEDVAKTGFNGAESAQHFLKRHFGDNLPTELRFFAENMRLSDLAEFADSVSFDEVVSRYLHRGYKKMFMDDAMEQTNQLVKDLHADGKINVVMEQRMNDFRETAYGMAQFTTEAVMTETTQQLGHKFRTWVNKIKGGDNRSASLAHQDMVDFFKALTVSSTMAFRPGLVARNLQQIYVTLGPVMDQGWVDAALASLHKKGVFSDLRRAIEDTRASGHMMGSISPLGELESHKGLLAKWNAMGMKWYQDSDAATRLVVDETVKMRMETPMNRLMASAKSTDDYKKFIADSGIGRLDPAHQQVILDTLDKFGPVPTLRKAQDLVQNFTMFSYQKFDNPAVFKGFIGKIFGMFGHYPIHYASMVKTMITHPDKTAAAMMVMNMAKSAAAFYLVGEQVMGISARNFLPWNQMLFTGGPYFDLMNQMITSAGGGPQGDMAAKQLPKQFFQLMVPFGMNTIYLGQKVPKQLESGDIYGAVLTAMSLPYVSPPDRMVSKL